MPAPSVFPEGCLVLRPSSRGGVRVQRRGERDTESAGQFPEDSGDAAGAWAGR